MRRTLELFLAKHCAPVLLGKKPAVLFREKHLPRNTSWRHFSAYGLRVYRLHRPGDKSLVLIYRPKLLEASVSGQLTRCSLERLGYPSAPDWRAKLGFLRKRFHESDAFPHEVGFFLGYPPEDVLGFMDCPMDCKLCGPWKVYGDVETAKTLFAEYARCRRVLLALVENGTSIATADLSALA